MCHFDRLSIQQLRDQLQGMKINLSGPVNKMIICKYLHSTVMAHHTSRSETAHAKIKIHIITLSELQTKVSKQQSNAKNK